MSVRIFHDNRLFDLSTLTPSSESTDLPATNTQQEERQRIWRTGSDAALETLVIDPGGNLAANAFLAHYTSVDPANDSGIAIKANTVNSWGSPAFTQSLTLNRYQDPNSLTPSITLLEAQFSALQTYAYWRYEFTKASAGVTRDTGRLFLGSVYSIAQAPYRDGISIVTKDGSIKTKGVGLNTFVELKEKYRVITLTFPPVSQTTIDNLDAIFRRVGQSVNIFLQIDQSSPYDEIYYCQLSNDYQKDLFCPTPGGPVWNLVLQFEEML